MTNLKMCVLHREVPKEQQGLQKILSIPIQLKFLSFYLHLEVDRYSENDAALPYKWLSGSLKMATKTKLHSEEAHYSPAAPILSLPLKRCPLLS